jgi:hypothetical protein
MATNDFRERFAAVAKRIKADFEESKLTQHHGSRGTAREEILVRFLELYVPGTAEVVHNTEIITLAGEISPQCDIVLVDRNTPRLQDLRSHRIVPAESVFGVIEVKSRMTGPELIDSCQKISAIKQLSREAYLTERGAPMMYRPQRFPRYPIFGYAFAYSGIGMGSFGIDFPNGVTTTPATDILTEYGLPIAACWSGRRCLAVMTRSLPGMRPLTTPRQPACCSLSPARRRETFCLGWSLR